MFRFFVPVLLSLDVRGYDKDDVYESVHAFIDALREKDFEGLQHLDQVFRVRPQFRPSDIQQLTKMMPGDIPSGEGLSRQTPRNSAAGLDESFGADGCGVTEAVP